jgi:glutathione peroxidase
MKTVAIVRISAGRLRKQTTVKTPSVTLFAALALVSIACSPDAVGEQGTSRSVSPAALAVPGEDRADVAPEKIDSLLFGASVKTIDGEMSSLGSLRGKALLVVNVASHCGYTPQYTGLQELHEKYSASGFSVVGFPCNQFGGQEPGSEADVKSFCSLNYGVTFPLFEKIEVNGGGRHRIYEALTKAEDPQGVAGDVRWNFEKFVISSDGSTISRFRSDTKPDDPALIAAIEAGLPGR